jgi:surface polysaccharide O-acyltransferase-like enzyme
MAGRDEIARQRNIAQKAVSCLLIVVALGLSVAAVFLVSDTHSFIKRAVLVHGKVVALERVPIPNKVVSLFYPIVTFTGKRGDQRTISTSAMIMPSIGEAVDVLYDKANPADARIASFWDLYFLPILAAIIATMLLCGAGGSSTSAPQRAAVQLVEGTNAWRRNRPLRWKGPPRNSMRQLTG